MDEDILLTHERVDDIPLLIGLAQKLRLPELLDRHIGNHGHHQGISNGWLTVVWLAFILSEGDHCKAHVQEWADRHQRTLSQLLGQGLRPVEFTDDRLGIVLRRLSNPQAWQDLEADLWESTLMVYEMAPVESVRVDATTTYGCHSVTPDGLMQYGFSKDHRPDCAQLKLMAAAVEPHGHLLAADVHSGERPDDPLYVPLIDRVRQMLGRTGLLYVGDSKMAAFSTRADIVAHGDDYLAPLAATGADGQQMPGWIEAAVTGQQATEPILDEAGEEIGCGYEWERTLRVEAGPDAPSDLEWVERVMVVRSVQLAERQQRGLEQRLRAAETAIGKLTPPPGRGKRQFTQEADLSAAVEQILKQHRVQGLLDVCWSAQERRRTRYARSGRPGPDAPMHEQVSVRYVIERIQRREEAIQAAGQRMGWRVLASSSARERLTLPQAALHYRGGWCLERDFHLLKDRPLGIHPLYVHRDEQIRGLSHLLLLALRLLSLIEVQVRRGLQDNGEKLSGLYEGQRHKQTDRPTGQRVLQCFARSEITLTHVHLGDRVSWHLTPLTPQHYRILAHLGLPPTLYQQLACNPANVPGVLRE